MPRILPRLAAFLVALALVLGLADALAARFVTRDAPPPPPTLRPELPREWRWEKKAHDFEFLWRVKGPREGRLR